MSRCAKPPFFERNWTKFVNWFNGVEWVRLGYKTLMILAMVVILLLFIGLILDLMEMDHVSEKFKKRMSENMGYMEYDGHEYVVFHKAECTAMSHSPKCFCITNNIEGLR